jgi:hypothetical protein
MFLPRRKGGKNKIEKSPSARCARLDAREKTRWRGVTRVVSNRVLNSLRSGVGATRLENECSVSFSVRSKSAKAA